LLIQRVHCCGLWFASAQAWSWPQSKSLRLAMRARSALWCANGSLLAAAERYPYICPCVCITRARASVRRYAGCVCSHKHSHAHVSAGTGDTQTHQRPHAQFVARLIRKVPTKVDDSNKECTQAVFKFMSTDTDGDGCNAHAHAQSLGVWLPVRVSRRVRRNLRVRARPGSHLSRRAAGSVAVVE